MVSQTLRQIVPIQPASGIGHIPDLLALDEDGWLWHGIVEQEDERMRYRWQRLDGPQMLASWEHDNPHAEVPGA